MGGGNFTLLPHPTERTQTGHTLSLTVARILSPSEGFVKPNPVRTTPKAPKALRAAQDASEREP